MNVIGLTPIAKLIDSDKFEWAKYLIENHGSRLDDLSKYKNDFGESLLHIAARKGNFEAFDYLLELGIFKDLNICGGNNNDTILNYIINSKVNYLDNDYYYQYCNNYKMFKLIIDQNGINPHIKNKYGFDAFDLCKRARKFNYLKELESVK